MMIQTGIAPCSPEREPLVALVHALQYIPRSNFLNRILQNLLDILFKILSKILQDVVTQNCKFLLKIAKNKIMWYLVIIKNV
jgi:hypothetical protein